MAATAEKTAFAKLRIVFPLHARFIAVQGAYGAMHNITQLRNM